MLKYLFILLPIIGVSQVAIRVEYEVKQEFINTSNDTKALSSDIFINSNNKRYFYELIVNKSVSNYKRIDRIDNTQTKGISIGLTEAGSNIYKNFDTDNLYEQTKINPKILVKDSIQTFPWILSKEESKILGYNVRKATYINPTQIVEAWYAPDLPFRDGPSRFNGLSGLILKIKFKANFPLVDADTYITISAIDIKPYTGKIELPKNTKVMEKEVSQEKAKKLYEKQKELRSQGVEKD
ncbi:GLPGLI family protein [Empedobacter falsenii]|uniref:GLPGLI family protein n=1 Tax=Empedobacter falsenii TaxID=343874 RepID=A0ABY8V857_9FLAO|nr:GLPGLI family protein [Empedobacter falsenii]WIH97874.1 GLPGLI family protein [Empedobacter falsenii]